MAEPIVRPSEAGALAYKCFARMFPGHIPGRVLGKEHGNTTTGQPVLDMPATVEVTDGFGTHAVAVEPWPSTAVAAPGEAPAAQQGTVQPSFGLVFPPTSVAIRDGWGTHQIDVVPWN